MCSLRLIACLIANLPGLPFVQGVLHCDLQYLHYELIDMDKLTPNTQEVMTSLNWLSVKQNLQTLQVWNLCCITLFGPLKQILPGLKNFCNFADL
jgi:hypothetical protein